MLGRYASAELGGGLPEVDGRGDGRGQADEEQEYAYHCVAGEVDG